jgi:hypothetical protein
VPRAAATLPLAANSRPATQNGSPQTRVRADADAIIAAEAAAAETAI